MLSPLQSRPWKPKWVVDPSTAGCHTNSTAWHAQAWGRMHADWQMVIAVEMNGFCIISQQYCSCRLDSAWSTCRAESFDWTSPEPINFFCKFGALLSLLLRANCHVFHGVLTAWKRLGTPDIQQGCSMLQSRLWINASTWLLWRVLFSLAFSLETKYQMALTNTTTEVTWTAILESRWCRWRSLSYRATDTVRGRLQSLFVPFRSCWSLWWYFCRKATNKSLQALQERVARNEEKSEQEVPCC